MPTAKTIYKLTHRGCKEEDIPYYYKYSLWTIIKKPFRKWLSASLIPRIPFNGIRVWLYKLIGYKIGKNVFIGMHCYLDDMCYDLMEIGNNVTVSYGVYFACHGRKQGHNKIVIKDYVYIGMRANIVARTDIEIGENAVVGACTLVNKSIPAGKTAIGIPCKIIE